MRRRDTRSRSPAPFMARAGGPAPVKRSEDVGREKYTDRDRDRSSPPRRERMDSRERERDRDKGYGRRR